MDQYDLTSQSPQYLEKMFFGDVLLCHFYCDFGKNKTGPCSRTRGVLEVTSF